MPKLTTIGVSPKAIGALVFPLVAAAGAAIASWIVSGEFNDSEIRAAASGVVLALVAFVGAYVRDPGNVVPAEPVDPVVPPGMG